MLDKIGHIKNPLTVISIFAAIAEISGTTVLPFIEPNNQSTYVWFLMLFPTLLVGVFFLTLNFNHKVLYAPSDYKNEDNFLKLFGKATMEEKEEKFREEFEESGTSATPETENLQSPTNIDRSTESGLIHERRNAFMANVALAERLSILKLSKELGINFKSDVKFETTSNRPVVFDAGAVHKDKVHAVEVRLFKNEHGIPMRLDKILLESEIVASQVKGPVFNDFILHLVAVIDNPEADKEKVTSRLQHHLSRYNINVDLHVTTLSDLKNEYKYDP